MANNINRRCCSCGETWRTKAPDCCPYCGSTNIEDIERVSEIYLNVPSKRKITSITDAPAEEESKWQTT